jgi:hypothetical protein
MLSSDFRGQIDFIWHAFRLAGISDSMSLLEQIIYRSDAGRAQR